MRTLPLSSLQRFYFSSTLTAGVLTKKSSVNASCFSRTSCIDPLLGGRLRLPPMLNFFFLGSRWRTVLACRVRLHFRVACFLRCWIVSPPLLALRRKLFLSTYCRPGVMRDCFSFCSCLFKLLQRYTFLSFGSPCFTLKGPH